MLPVPEELCPSTYVGSGTPTHPTPLSRPATRAALTKRDGRRGLVSVRTGEFILIENHPLYAPLKVNLVGSAGTDSKRPTKR